MSSSKKEPNGIELNGIELVGAEPLGAGFAGANGSEGCIVSGEDGSDKGGLASEDRGDGAMQIVGGGLLSTFNYWCGFLKKSWFIKESVLLLGLTFPLVSVPLYCCSIAN